MGIVAETNFATFSSACWQRKCIRRRWMRLIGTLSSMQSVMLSFKRGQFSASRHISCEEQRSRKHTTNDKRMPARFHANVNVILLAPEA